MLPWFIFKEIINYSVLHDRHHCLVNKECFKASAGQFITIGNSNMSINSPPLEWTKLAENLYISGNKSIKWEYIREFHHIKSVYLRCLKLSTVDLNRFAEFILQTNVNSISITYYDLDDINQYIEILKIICKRLKKITINTKCQSHIIDQLLSFDYFNIKMLEIHQGEGTLCFNMILRYLEKFEYVLIISYDIYFTTNNIKYYKFSKLKSLEIRFESYSIEGMDIFRQSFPSLESFSLEFVCYKNSLNLISQSMPKLEFLKLVIHHGHNSKIVFPQDCLNKLKGLIINDLIGDKNSSLLIQINLAKLPQLYKFISHANSELINSDVNHCPHINFLEFGNIFSLNFDVLDRFSNLNEVIINRYSISGADSNQIIVLLKKVPILVLNDIVQLSTKFLVSGPFKTTQLTLLEFNSPTYVVIVWLAKEFKLTHLTVNVYEIEKNLKPVKFQHLKKLNLCGFNNEPVKHYYKSIILSDYIQ